jgi:hypothetical protein
MSLLIESFPLLAAELSQQLRSAGRTALADQINRAVIARVTFEETINAGYIYLQPSRDLNLIEANIIGVRYGSMIEVETPYWTNIDIDNFERLMGIEILTPGDLKDDLKKHASS